jgi:protein arginine kinase activator
MLCESCGERDAVITLTKVVDTERNELRLCEKCAAERGIETTVSSTQHHALGQFLTAVQKQLPTTLPDQHRCTFCSATLRDFRTVGRLGCAHCYAAFEPSLRDLLRRVHGHSRHSGKRYAPPADVVGAETARLEELRERLQRAVESEQFELAARLRDQLKVLE